MPRGVHGRRPNWRRARWPTFSGWKPSTSLRGSMRWISPVASRRSGQRQLHQDAVDLRVGVEAVDQGQQFVVAGVGRQVVVDRADAHFLRRTAFVAHIDAGGRIVADQHHRQARARLARRHARVDLGLEVVEQVLGDALAVEDAGGGRWASRRSCGRLRYSRGRALSPIQPHAIRCTPHPAPPDGGHHDRHRFRNHPDRSRRLPAPAPAPDARTRPTCRTST